MNDKIVVIILILILVSQSSILAQGGRKYIRQGNKNYEKELYQESEILYRKSLDKDQSSYEASFNLGDALYKQEKYEDATMRFSDLTDDKREKTDISKIYHNLGNSLLSENRIGESIEAYKNALRNNPDDPDTKHNLAYAMNLLQQQQQSRQQQQQDQKNQGDQEQQGQEQEQQQQQNQEQENQKEEQMNQEQHEDQISEEDANRILEALQQDEQKLLEELKKQKAQARRVTVLKDW